MTVDVLYDIPMKVREKLNLLKHNDPDVCDSYLEAFAA